MAVDRVGRHARSWRDIQGLTCNSENEGKTNNLGWMLYSVYAVLGVCCTRCMLYSVYAVLGVNSWSCHGAIERDDLTLCSAMMVEMWMRKREMGDADENDVEDTSGYVKSGVRLTWLGWEELVLVLLHAGSGLVPPVSGMVNCLAHEILLSPSFSWWSVPSPLPPPKNTKLSHPSLSLHAMIKSQPGSRSRGWGWEVMILPGHEDSRNCVDPRNRGKSEWDQKMGKIECVFRIMRWCFSSPGSALQSLRIMRWYLSTPWSWLESRCKRVPNEPIPMYGHSWPQCQSVCLK